MPVLNGFYLEPLVWTRDHLNMVPLDQLGDHLYEDRQASGNPEPISGRITSYNVCYTKLLRNGGQPDVQGEGPITLSMPFQALLDSTTNTNIIIERTPA